MVTYSWDDYAKSIAVAHVGQRKKWCFVISPIGDEGSLVRERSDVLKNDIISVVVKKHGYEVSRADSNYSPRAFISNIDEEITGADLVIADLTGNNPNVMYELGKCHFLGLKCINICDNIKNIPSDLQHINTIQYDISTSKNREETKRKLEEAVLSAGRIPWAPGVSEVEFIQKIFKHTTIIDIAYGRDDPYQLAAKIANKKCLKILLMQRSSSIILGAERGWGAEEEFYNILMRKAKNSLIDFRHIVSIDGILSHIRQRTSVFPDLDRSLKQLSEHDGRVLIRGKRDHFIKRLPFVNENSGFKLDRQARLFLSQCEDGVAEGTIVIDLGSEQCAIHVRGDAVASFMAKASNFYDAGCPYLLWDQLNELRSHIR